MSERPESVTVTGTGRVSVRPDVVEFSLGTEVRAASLAAALSESSVPLGRMIERLRTGGVPDRDLRTTGLSTYTRTDDDGRVTGYVCSQSLTAALADLAVAPALLDATLAEGGAAARVHGLHFSIADPSVPAREARRLAVADARAKAEQLAAGVDRALGRAIRIEEEPGAGRPRPMYAELRSSFDSAPPLQPGAEDVTVSVTVSWAFAD
ncbi:SIMPL domain-containing protein [soil metagenome]